MWITCFYGFAVVHSVFYFCTQTNFSKKTILMALLIGFISFSLSLYISMLGYDTIMGLIDVLSTELYIGEKTQSHAETMLFVFHAVLSVMFSLLLLLYYQRRTAKIKSLYGFLSLMLLSSVSWEFARFFNLILMIFYKTEILGKGL